MPKDEQRPADWAQEWPWIPDITDDEVELIRAETRRYNEMAALPVSCRARLKQSAPATDEIRQRMQALEDRIKARRKNS